MMKARWTWWPRRDSSRIVDAKFRSAPAWRIEKRIRISPATQRTFSGRVGVGTQFLGRSLAVIFHAQRGEPFARQHGIGIAGQRRLEESVGQRVLFECP